ncbi:MAG: hypothetical protein P2A85_29585 (plasmid) [Microcoleus anatoxicus]|uniref:hypothetical protein n=1 Tax=Microcoleus anatoxicus TaxID=2705319 RepID=UPI00366FFF33
MNASEFLKSLVIPEPQEYAKLTANVASAQVESAQTAATDGNAKSAQINVGCLCVFSEGLTVQNKSDVMNSTLLAQLSANQSFDRFAAPMDWYNYYINLLGNIGWNIPAWSNQTIPETSPMNWEEAVLRTMASIETGDAMALAKAGMKATQGLESNSKGMKIWSANSSSETNGNFQIMPVMPMNGTVVAVTSGIHFQSTMSQGAFLSWSMNFAIQGGCVKAELNEDIYSKVRQQIIDKIGNRAMTNVADIPF